MEMEAYCKELARALWSVGLPFYVVEFYTTLIGQLFGHKVRDFLAAVRACVLIACRCQVAVTSGQGTLFLTFGFGRAAVT